MKGIVFTEFLEMVEAKFGYEMVDELLNETDLPSGGAYTAIGTYHHAEIVSLVVRLGRKTGVPISTLLHNFGQYLFQTFTKVYGQFFADAKDAFHFLESIDIYIHVEVKKLYPDAELPNFQTKRIGEGALEMIYQSERSMADLAEGLIFSCLQYFGENAEIKREPLDENGQKVRFLIERNQSSLAIASC